MKFFFTILYLSFPHIKLFVGFCYTRWIASKYNTLARIVQLLFGKRRTSNFMFSFWMHKKFKPWLYCKWYLHLHTGSYYKGAFLLLLSLPRWHFRNICHFWNLCTISKIMALTIKSKQRSKTDKEPQDCIVIEH